MFDNPETTPGGVLKFYSSVRVDIRRIGAIKNTDGSVSGNHTRLKVVKNKVAPPFTEAEFDIMYNEGISAVGSLLDLALEHGILLKEDLGLAIMVNNLVREETPKEAIKGDQKLYGEIESAVQKAMNGELDSRMNLSSFKIEHITH